MNVYRYPKGTQETLRIQQGPGPMRERRKDGQRTSREGARRLQRNWRRTRDPVARPDGSTSIASHPSDAPQGHRIAGASRTGDFPASGRARGPGKTLRPASGVAEEPPQPVAEVRASARTCATERQGGRLHDGAADRSGHRRLRKTEEGHREIRGKCFFLFYVQVFRELCILLEGRNM